jgi:hypothetical protein
MVSFEEFKSSFGFQKLLRPSSGYLCTICADLELATAKIFAACAAAEVVIIVQSSDEFSWAPTVSQSLLARHSNWRNAVIPEGSIMSKVALRKGMRRYEAGLGTSTSFVMPSAPTRTRRSIGR